MQNVKCKIVGLAKIPLEVKKAVTPAKAVVEDSLKNLDSRSLIKSSRTSFVGMTKTEFTK